jgi:hypothetical protein
MMSAIKALQTNPTSWKLYKPYQEFAGYSYSRFEFKNFTKLMPEQQSKLADAVRLETERFKSYVSKYTEDLHNAEKQIQDAIQDMQRIIQDPDATKGIKKIPVDLSGWSVGNEDLKDKVEKRIREEAESMIGLLDGVEEGALKQQLVGLYRAKIENARQSYGEITLDASTGASKGGKASWHAWERVLRVNVPDYYSADTLRDLERTVRHELRHFAQSYLAHMTGDFDKVKPLVNGRPLRHPQPGFPSKKIMTPDIQQTFDPDRYERGQMPKEMAEGLRYIRQQGLVPSEMHSLDDAEFYTNLADAVGDFKYLLSKYPEWDSAEKRRAFDSFVGTVRDDPRYTVSPFFRTLWLRARPKWKKAVTELAKVVLSG